MIDKLGVRLSAYKVNFLLPKVFDLWTIVDEVHFLAHKFHLKYSRRECMNIEKRASVNAKS